MVAWGDKDPWEPVELGRAYADFNVVEEFIVLPNVGHCPQVNTLFRYCCILLTGYIFPWLLIFCQKIVWTLPQVYDIYENVRDLQLFDLIIFHQVHDRIR